MYKPFDLTSLFLVINFIETFIKVEMCAKIDIFPATLFVIIKN